MVLFILRCLVTILFLIGAIILVILAIIKKEGMIGVCSVITFGLFLFAFFSMLNIYDICSDCNYIISFASCSDCCISPDIEAHGN